MKKFATISPCGTYRYWLERVWAPDPMAMRKGYVNFLMLNPSTADAEKDDPTVRKCMGFARRWGYDAMHIVNLFALRSTDPNALNRAAHATAFGPDNAAMIEAGFLSAPLTVCAWGGHPAAARGIASVAEIYRRMDCKPRVVALRLNADGSPQHPLYVPYDVTPVPFSLEAA